MLLERSHTAEVIYERCVHQMIHIYAAKTVVLSARHDLQYGKLKPGWSGLVWKEDACHLQIVWKSTKGVGCAKKMCSDDWTYLDCNYVPPGNVIGQFSQNVFSIKS